MVVSIARRYPYVFEITDGRGNNIIDKKTTGHMILPNMATDTTTLHMITTALMIL